MGSGDMPDIAANVYPLPEKVGVTDGMIMDQGGNLYLTAPDKNGVLQYSRDGKLTLLIQDASLLWPDSLSLGPDGEIYVTASQVQFGARFNNGQDKFQPPFKLFRIDGFKAMMASRADYGMSD
jgi:sugar lactone lactonase YvrE